MKHAILLTLSAGIALAQSSTERQVRHGNILFENDGSGKFADISKASGIDVDVDGISTS